MDKDLTCAAFAYWRQQHTAPFHFPMDTDTWLRSMTEDVDSDGRNLFRDLTIRCSRTAPDKDGSINGMVQYGHTAFGFSESGNISGDVHYPVIRDLCFDDPAVGKQLLDAAVAALGSGKRIYAYFHYFGMSACGRHGKLHEKDDHIEKLLLENGFVVEHENVYYARWLTEADIGKKEVTIQWKELSAGGCREFAAVRDGREFCWGQVHFLPQQDIAYLRWIFVDGCCQHQGLGTAAMKALFSQLYSMGIRRFDTDTALNNTSAQGYYEKTGFRREGITRSYYTV